MHTMDFPNCTFMAIGWWKSLVFVVYIHNQISSLWPSCSDMMSISSSAFVSTSIQQTLWSENTPSPPQVSSLTLPFMSLTSSNQRKHVKCHPSLAFPHHTPGGGTSEDTWGGDGVFSDDSVCCIDVLTKAEEDIDIISEQEGQVRVGT